MRIQREAILRDLLPIIDNLERALAAARSGTDAKTIVDGVEMTVRALIDFLRAQGVTPLQSVGQAFDPNRHEAVDHVASEAHPPNTVVDEFHRGYLIGDAGSAAGAGVGREGKWDRFRKAKRRRNRRFRR